MNKTYLLVVYYGRLFLKQKLEREDLGSEPIHVLTLKGKLPQMNPIYGVISVE